ncbi:vacuolar fusion protein MON1 homolog A-like isoform X2 [Physella acuta]|uniref:vacuolar fusion protein MON1 homolog A-like isoform X2 n=1 Tax=Physella acuta TaxID=109671 RepID=UPI0027DAEE7D|nr:vacuolar fusion protein MON1 homolog A-like isoform X2 [Physella acuta]
MAAEVREALLVGNTSDSDSAQSDLIETSDTPGKSDNCLLLASDSFEDLSFSELSKGAISTCTGTINSLVNKKAKKRSISSLNSVTGSDDTVVETIESLEVSVENTDESVIPNDCTSDNVIGSAINKILLQDNDEKESERILPHLIASNSETDYVNSLEWKQQKKHIFILSESGKPIYRVTKGKESTQQILLQLNYMYSQVISVLTHTTLTRIFRQHRNYDLRRPLSGAEKFFDNLLNLMDIEPGLLLTSVRCLPLDSAVRDTISQTIVQYAKVKDLVFALIIAQNQLVAVVRMKKYYLHPMDMHLILNLINASESFKAAESWTPICLPKFDAAGFLQAHVSYLDDECQTCLLLLSVDIEAFYILSDCKAKIKERLQRYNALSAIGNSLRRNSYSIQQCSISDLRHFLYKARSTAQYTSPELEAPYNTKEEQERLFGLYYYLHDRIHTSGRPLKILFHVGPYETLLGWITQGFELYAVFGPLVTKISAIHAVNKLLRWIKKEEDRLFILNSVTF